MPRGNIATKDEVFNIRGQSDTDRLATGSYKHGVGRATAADRAVGPCLSMVATKRDASK